MQVSIYTIASTVYEGEADAVQLPGADGELGVLATHVPLISLLKRGSIRLRHGSSTDEIPVGGGFVEIQAGSKVVVLAETL